MEQWNLYDEFRNPLNKLHTRGIPLPKGCYHIAVETWTINKDKQFLLTKRAPEKEIYPNYWETTGGSILAGETSKQGVARELFEETGIQATEKEFVFLKTHVLKKRLTLVDSYFLQKDFALTDIILQAHETVEAKLVNFVELEAMIEQQLLPNSVIERYQKIRTALINQLSL